jgi:eukaryotic-like serine/threonine-protein kinase
MWLGDVLEGRFVVERPIGKGGMGSVYLASDRKTGTPVAVKVMDSTGVSLDERFAQEVTALERVTHPAIVRYLSSGRTDTGEPYLVMEWLDGESLDARLAREPLSVPDSLTATRRAAEALVAAHASGVLHRDLKPSNLYLVDGDPARLKVVDFGIARVGTGPGLTSTGSLLGTVGYMAPEQALDAKRVTDRADVFSLGCVLFECLTGSPPFKGATPVAVLSRLLVEAPRPPSALRSGLPAPLDDLVLALLSRDPRARPSAEEVLKRIAALKTRLTTDPIAPTVAAVTQPRPSGERWTQTVLYVRAPPGCPDAPGEGMIAPPHAHPFADALAKTARVFGGSSIQVDAHTWLVTFPERGPATDRARRAALCSLACRDAGLARMVLATVRSDSADRSAGPALERAVEFLDARLEAPEGTVLLDAVTASLIDTAFEVERHGDQHVLMSGKADQGVARLLMGKRTPFVGRERELAVLEATLAECMDDATARVVFVTAPPGTGKSRLRMEFMERVSRRGDVKTLLARGEIHAGVSFAVARQLVSAAAGLSPGLSAEESGQRLAAHTESLLPRERAHEVGEFLAESLGLPFPGPPSPAMRSARLDSETMASLVLDAFDGWIAAERAAAPLLVVIEDLQWADTASIDVLVRAAKRPSPALLVVVLARPEGIQLFPTLAGLDVALPLRLPGLAARAAERLVRAALGEHATSENVARVVSLADGNAFFLEELVRAIAEDRTGALPESVLSMAEARLAALEPEARRILRAGSVLGERFAVEALLELVGDGASAREWLETLADREVLERPGGERTGGAPEFLFRHALLRESAYAQLDPGDRTGHHASAAAWLERQSTPDPIAIAEHWERGGDNQRAVTWLATAAEAAWDAFDWQGGRKLLARAAALGGTSIDRGRLLLVEHWCTKDAARAFECAAEAVELLPEGTNRWVQAVGQAFFVGVEIGRPEALQHLMKLLQYVERPIERDPRVAYALYVATAATTYGGHLDVARRLAGAFGEGDSGGEDPLFDILRMNAIVFEKIYSNQTLEGVVPATRLLPALAQTMRTRRGRYQAHFALASAWALLAAWPEAIASYSAALDDDTMTPGFTASTLARVLARTGEVDRALSLLSQYAGGRGFQGLQVEVIRAWVLHFAGRLQEADERAHAIADKVAALQPFAAACDLVKSSAALERGESERSLELAEEGLSRPGVIADVWAGLNLCRVRALLALGRDEDAIAVLRVARDHFFALRDTIEDPLHRARYIEAFPEARELVRLAARLA